MDITEASQAAKKNMFSACSGTVNSTSGKLSAVNVEVKNTSDNLDLARTSRMESELVIVNL